jgi:hypothetical protein
VRWIIALVAGAFVGLTSPAFAFGDCTSPHYIGVFDDRLNDGGRVGEPRCIELARFEIPHSGRLTKMRVLGVVGDRRDNDLRWISHVEALARRLGGPMEAMGPLDLPEVSVLLTSLTDELEDEGEIVRAHAAAWSPHENECFITFYKMDEPISVDEFVFTYAHELFHCMQQKTWGVGTLGDHQFWWMEGSAEYFAQLVEQGTSFSDGFFAEFNQKSLRTSLFDMNYENVVFFLWLGQERRPSGVRALLEALARGGDGSAHLATMRSAVPIDAWKDFAESYMDGDLIQPGGRAVPRPNNAREIIEVANARRVPLATAPYVVSRYGMSFKEGQTYKLAVEGPDSIRIRMAERANMWSDPPARVLACDEDKNYRTAVLTVEEEASTTLVVDDPEELDQRACCLIGEWQPTAAALDSFAREAHEIGSPAVASRGASLTCGHVSGDWTVWFNPDGKGGVRWNDYTNRCVTTAPGGSMIQTQTTYGDHEFDWTIVDRGFGEWTWTKHEVRWRLVMEIGPIRQEHDDSEGTPFVRKSGFAYQCTADTLNIKGLLGLGRYQYDHNRFGGPPRP